MPGDRVQAVPAQPNARFDHAYAILRLDDPSGQDVSESDVTVRKVVWSQEAAESEVSRLNSLNADKGARYFWQITRIERRKPKARLRAAP
jgi:hypothetical protein